MTAPESVTTARLHLRKPVPDDALLMFQAYAQDPEVAHYLPWCPHRTVSDSEAVIGRFLAGWDSGSGFQWLLFLRDGGALAGAVGIRRDMHGAELGYVLARPFLGPRAHDGSSRGDRLLGFRRQFTVSHRRGVRRR
jgi:RimJ/RimL family protein N-acetyltransferase